MHGHRIVVRTASSRGRSERARSSCHRRCVDIPGCGGKVALNRHIPATATTNRLASVGAEARSRIASSTARARPPTWPAATMSVASQARSSHGGPLTAEGPVDERCLASPTVDDCVVAPHVVMHERVSVDPIPPTGSQFGEPLRVPGLPGVPSVPGTDGGARLAGRQRCPSVQPFVTVGPQRHRRWCRMRGDLGASFSDGTNGDGCPRFARAGPVDPRRRKDNPSTGTGNRKQPWRRDGGRQAAEHLRFSDMQAVRRRTDDRAATFDEHASAVGQRQPSGRAR